MTELCRIVILYDHETLPGFVAGWGFSALVQTPAENVLFDCGWDGHRLRTNLGRLGMCLADIRKVVISHHHWDHLSGLSEVLHDSVLGRPLEVYVPSSFSARLKEEIAERAVLVEVSAMTRITPCLYSTGVLGSDVKEQSLILRTRAGSTVITGCAHPGLSAILGKAEELGPLKCLLGGFHDARTEDLPPTLERVVACHCTARKAEIVRSFGERACIGAVGMTFELEL